MKEGFHPNQDNGLEIGKFHVHVFRKEIRSLADSVVSQAVEKGEIEFSYKGKRFQLQKTKPKLSTSTEEHRRMDNIALDYEVQLIEE